MSLLGKSDLKKEEIKEEDIKNWNTSFEDRGISVLLYGDTGSGKTYTAMTFPETIHVIDTENRAILTKEHQFKDKKINITEVMEVQEFKIKDRDVFDEHKSIENITKKVIELANKAKKGELKGHTIILDSCTDLWTWIQQWMVIELAKRFTAKGQKKADVVMMRVNNQLDWKMANRRHYDIVECLKALNKYGVNVIYTAREREPPPDYISTSNRELSTKEKIRSQKDLPFTADIRFQLQRKKMQNEYKYLATCEKLQGLAPPVKPIENISYDKIIKLIKGDMNGKIENKS